MLAAGLLKLGFLTRFIANAVLRGFLTGIGVNIILGQLGDFTGYASEYENKVVKAVDTLLHLNQIDLQVLLVGVNPAVYEQLTETQFLVVLGAENVFVASKPGESTLQAYEKAQQLIKAGNTQTYTALEVAP